MGKIRGILAGILGMFAANAQENKPLPGRAISYTSLREIAVRMVREETGNHWIRHSHRAEINEIYTQLKRINV